MKKLLIILTAIILVACHKEVNHSSKPSAQIQALIENDDLSFLTTGVPSARGGKPGKPVKDTVPIIPPTYTPPPDTAGPACAFLDFDGAQTNNTQWSQQTFSTSGLTEEQINVIVDSGAFDYRDLRIVFTTNESLFRLAPLNKRQWTIFTPDCEWYSTDVAGVTLNSSAFTGKDIPNFVFTVPVIRDNTKFAWEAYAHELGHALGEHHIAQWENDVYVGPLDWLADAGEDQGHTLGGPFYNVTKHSIGRWGDGTWVNVPERLKAKLGAGTYQIIR